MSAARFPAVRLVTSTSFVFRYGCENSIHCRGSLLVELQAARLALM
jgi:hypothetical protein